MEELDPYVIADILERTGNFPSYARVSTTFSKASDILMLDLVFRMNEEYPLWDIQMLIDVFYLLFAKAIYSNDYIAAKLILKLFIKGSMHSNWVSITHVMGILYLLNRELFNSLLSIFPQGYANKLLFLKGKFGEYSPGRYKSIDYGTFPSLEHLLKYNRNPIQLSKLSMPYLIYKYPNMWNENLKNVDLGSESISTAIKLAIIMALHDQGLNLPIPNNI